MDPTGERCVACGAALPSGRGRCPTCRAWQPSAAWDRALYLGFAALTALVMAVRWWLRRTVEPPLPLAELWRAWLHPAVMVPFALTLVFALRVLRRL
jgi:hypothetical protein